MDSYYYLNSNNEQVGPVSPTDFSRYGITQTTMVWKSGMTNWMQAGQISELLQYLSPTTPPPSPIVNKPVKPNSNLIWAILSTLFCCLPIGIYSIIQASKVDGLYFSGNYEEAQRMADEAKKWAIISAVLALIVFFLYFLAVIISVS